MPNHRKMTFMRSSIPNSPMKAGRKAVIGMERMGAATGLTKSWTQRKLAMKSPSGMAITAHQKNAWPIRHQLNATFLSSSLSFQSAGKAVDEFPVRKYCPHGNNDHPRQCGQRPPDRCRHFFPD